MTKAEQKRLIDAAVTEAKAVHFFAMSDLAVKSAVVAIIKAAGLTDEFNAAWQLRLRK